MASLIDNLVEVLQSEQQQYEQLVELAQQKKHYVITANIKGIESTTEQEQIVAGELRNLDIRRDLVLKDISDVLGKDTDQLNVTKVIDLLQQQPLEQSKLKQVRETLLAVATQMRLLNEQNDNLIQQAKEMVEFDLTLFKSMRQAPETANYNKRAYNTGSLLGGRGFDTKQ
ncbi:MAG: flagellar protein FlgN [Lachnospiraceae bacterium]